MMSLKSRDFKPINKNLPSKKPQSLQDANTELLFQTLRNSMSQRTVFLLNVCAQTLNKVLANIFKFQQYLFKKITKCHLFQEYKDGLTFENQSIYHINRKKMTILTDADSALDKI